jgi:hypothetical protein
MDKLDARRMPQCRFFLGAIAGGTVAGTTVAEMLPVGFLLRRATIQVYPNGEVRKTNGFNSTRTVSGKTSFSKGDASAIDDLVPSCGQSFSTAQPQRGLRMIPRHGRAHG